MDKGTDIFNGYSMDKIYSVEEVTDLVMFQGFPISTHKITHCFILPDLLLVHEEPRFAGDISNRNRDGHSFGIGGV